MRLRWRKLERGETDWELVFGVLWAPLFLLSVGAVMFIPSSLVPRCRFHRILGIPCPTCGAYRATRLLLSGQWCEAFVTQPLTMVATALLLLFSIYSWITVLHGSPRLRPDGMSRHVARTFTLVAVVLIVLNWLYLIADGR